MFSINSIIGMAEEQAIMILKLNAVNYRIVEKNGKGRIRTDDIQKTRVNLVITNDKVSQAYRG